MLPEYHKNDFEEQDLQCSNCNWKGKGYDAVIIDFFGVTNTSEVHCPNCDETIGILVKDTGKTTDGSTDDSSSQTD